MVIDKNIGTKILTINDNEFPLNLATDYIVYNTKTYVTSPLRSNDGSIGNINDYDVFYVPRIIINFNFISFENYLYLNDIINSTNEYTIYYFDTNSNQYVTDKFYLTPEESEKMLYVNGSIKGLENLTLSFIGTLNNTRNSIIRFIDESSTWISTYSASFGYSVDLSSIVEIPNYNEDYYYYWKDTTTGVIYSASSSIILNKRNYEFQLVVKQDG